MQSTRQAHYWSETPIGRVYKNIQLTSCNNSSVAFKVPIFALHVHSHIEENRGHEGSGLVFEYDYNVLIDIIFMNFQ
jgi:hypothetical protein